MSCLLDVPIKTSLRAIQFVSNPDSAPSSSEGIYAVIIINNYIFIILRSNKTKIILDSLKSLITREVIIFIV